MYEERSIAGGVGHRGDRANRLLLSPGQDQGLAGNGGNGNTTAVSGTAELQKARASLEGSRTPPRRKGALDVDPVLPVSIWTEYVKENGNYEDIARLRDYFHAEFQLLTCFLFKRSRK